MVQILKLITIIIVIGIVRNQAVSNNLQSKLKEAFCASSPNCPTDAQPCKNYKCFYEFDKISDQIPTKLTNDPKIVCKQSDLVRLIWTSDQEIKIFFEVTTENEKMYTNLTIPNTVYTIWGLHPNTKYEVRIWGANQDQNVILQSKFIEFSTSSKTENPLPVFGLWLKKLILTNYTFGAIIEWTPSQDLACFYDLTWFEADSNNHYKQIEIRKPTDLFRVTISDLGMHKNYSISIVAVNSDWTRESPKTWLHFQTPTCLESHSSLEKCPPEIPRNLIIIEEKILKIWEDGKTFTGDITIGWTKPIEFLPKYYIGQVINLVPKSIKNVQTHTINITGNENRTTFAGINLATYYQVTLQAFSDFGASDLAFKTKHTNITKPIIKPGISENNIIFLTTLIASCLILFIIIATILIIKFRKIKKNSTLIFDHKRNLDEIIIEPSKIDEDEWTLLPHQLQILEVLGEGCFGIVRKGMLELNGKKLEVAVKSLKNFSNQEELRQFYGEINIMKSVARHKNLVSIIGCINNQSGPLLVVQYCSKGNLLIFLHHIFDSLNEISSDNGVSNKLYEISEFPQTKYLILIMYQVALGMEYLSGLHVLHRDLAARNILVCEDGSVKISDFGLSRDVYSGDIYWKSDGAKLPIRWMAIESLTHQIYTTKSDVWSFGILMWEIVTFGGDPYPGVDPRKLPKLLQSGYRMEQPKCCDKLYGIMQKCWAAAPKDRPCFRELREQLDELLGTAAEYLKL